MHPHTCADMYIDTSMYIYIYICMHTRTYAMIKVS